MGFRWYLAQIGELLAKQPRDAPVLLLGDFNTWNPKRKMELNANSLLNLDLSRSNLVGTAD